MSVELHGGPMDNWIVKPDAPVLRSDWYRTIPIPPRRSIIDMVLRRPGKPRMARAGHYGLSDDGRSATWVEG